MPNTFKLSELNLTNAQKQERANIRNAYLVANAEECRNGAKVFANRGNWFAVACILEISNE